MGDELEKHYTLKIDLFVKIAPQKFRLKYQGARERERERERENA